MERLERSLLEEQVAQRDSSLLEQYQTMVALGAVLLAIGVALGSQVKSEAVLLELTERHLVEAWVGLAVLGVISLRFLHFEDKSVGVLKEEIKAARERVGAVEGKKEKEQVEEEYLVEQEALTRLFRGIYAVAWKSREVYQQGKFFFLIAGTILVGGGVLVGIHGMMTVETFPSGMREAGLVALFSGLVFFEFSGFVALLDIFQSHDLVNAYTKIMNEIRRVTDQRLKAVVARKAQTST